MSKNPNARCVCATCGKDKRHMMSRVVELSKYKSTVVRECFACYDKRK